MNRAMEQLLEVGFLTGSRAFGTAREDSDYDIIYQIHDSVAIDTIIEKEVRNPSGYFSGYTVMIEGKLVNLIPLHPHEFAPWMLATQAMKAALKLSGLTNKIHIHSIFMGMVCMFKGTMEQRGTLNEYDKFNKELKNKIISLDNLGK